MGNTSIISLFSGDVDQQYIWHSNSSGYISSLQHAVCTRNVKEVKDLIDKGADVNQYTTGTVPSKTLQLATEQLEHFWIGDHNPYSDIDCDNLIEIMKLLIKNGADPYKIYSNPSSLTSIGQINHIMSMCPGTKKCGEKMKNAIKTEHIQTEIMEIRKNQRQ